MADAADLIAPDEAEGLPTAIDLREEYNKSGVAEVLDELDRELIGPGRRSSSGSARSPRC